MKHLRNTTYLHACGHVSTFTDTITLTFTGSGSISHFICFSACLKTNFGYLIQRLFKINAKYILLTAQLSERSLTFSSVLKNRLQFSSWNQPNKWTHILSIKMKYCILPHLHFLQKHFLYVFFRAKQTLIFPLDTYSWTYYNSQSLFRLTNAISKTYLYLVNRINNYNNAALMTCRKFFQPARKLFQKFGWIQSQRWH